MKTTKQFLLALAAVALVSFSFVSCGGDDESREILQGGSFSKVYQIPLKGAINQTSGYPTTPVSLSFSEIIGSDKVTNFVGGSANDYIDLSNAYIQVTGLKAIKDATGKEISLANFTIKDVNLGTINPSGSNGALQSDVKIYGANAKVLTILKNIYSEIVNNPYKSDVKISYIPTSDIESTDKVFLEISIAGTSYKYYK